MTTPEPPAPSADPSSTADIALAAAVAAIADRPLDDDRRAARRATAVIDAIRAHRPGAG